MQNKTRFKKLFAIFFALVMMSSPVLLAGCSLFDLYPSNTNTSQPQNNNNNNNNNNGNNNGGNGGNGGNNQPTSSVYDPPAEDEITFEEYGDYFKNYRITYKPDEVDRNSFNNEIFSQNISIANTVLNNIYLEYGTTSDGASPKLNGNDNGKIKYIESDSQYLIYTTENQSYYVRYNNDSVEYFSHANAINNDSPNNCWLWNTNGDNQNTSVSKADFVQNPEFQAKLQLAELLILAGETLNQDGSGTFASAYSKYFANNNPNNALLSTYYQNNQLRTDALTDIVSTINYLGFTEANQETLANFVLIYVIGSDLVGTDNARFVNCYYDGSMVNIVDDSRYNRYLTDETYATAVVESNTTEFSLNTDKHLDGLLYYASEYLKQSSRENSFDATSFYLEGYLSSVADDGVSGSENNVAEIVFNNLIKTEQNQSTFNSNVWNYDSNGNINSSNATQTVVYKKNNNTYALFSVRLPYFKNYFNTISFLIRGVFDSQTSQQTLDDWLANHGFEYPYSSNYPNIPLSYFADYDNADMLFDGNTVTHMYSGYKAYQSMVIMPSQEVYLKEAALFVVRQDTQDSEAEAGDFEITVYARYYDAETQSYATWGENDDEFYLIGTLNVAYKQMISGNGIVDSVPNVLQIDTKTILSTAKINGQEKEDYLLSAFAEDEEVLLHQENLLSKENYGWLFNEYQTPQGDYVVCFDGKSAGSQSYLEIVISNPTDGDFQFCFCPTLCYEKNN